MISIQSPHPFGQTRTRETNRNVPPSKREQCLTEVTVLQCRWIRKLFPFMNSTLNWSFVHYMWEVPVTDTNSHGSRYGSRYSVCKELRTSESHLLQIHVSSTCHVSHLKELVKNLYNTNTMYIII